MEKRFFAIRGYMKSGTNWVGNLLNLHPEISSRGEFHWERFLEAATFLAEDYLLKNRKLDGWFKDRAYQLVRDTLVRVNSPTATVIGDRTPAKLEPLLLPEAKYINVIRDGRDVLVSRLFHLYNNPQVTTVFDQSPEMAKYLIEFQKDRWFFQKNPGLLFVFEPLVLDSIRNWAGHLAADRATMERFPDLCVLNVHYEQLHNDVEKQFHAMTKFLEVDPAFRPSLPEDVRPGLANESPDSFYRKGVVGDWRHYMGEKIESLFNDLAGSELERYGYAC